MAAFYYCTIIYFFDPQAFFNSTGLMKQVIQTIVQPCSMFSTVQNACLFRYVLNLNTLKVQQFLRIKALTNNPNSSFTAQKAWKLNPNPDSQGPKVNMLTTELCWLPLFCILYCLSSLISLLSNFENVLLKQAQSHISKSDGFLFSKICFLQLLLGYEKQCVRKFK